MLILDALSRVDIPGLLLVIVPRHPQRFDEVAGLVRARGLSMKRRSLEEFPALGTAIWLGDSMGEMASYYAAADIALIGGSLLPFGGQNLIEAAACACPVLVGPHTFNFAQAASDALSCGAARLVPDAGTLPEVLGEILRNPAQRIAMKEKAIAFSHAHQGATERTMALLAPLIAGAPSED